MSLTRLAEGRTLSGDEWMLWLRTDDGPIFELTLDGADNSETAAAELTEVELRLLWQAVGDALLALSITRHPAGSAGLLEAVLDRRSSTPQRRRRWRR